MDQDANITHPSLISLDEALKKDAPLVIEELWDTPKALVAARALKITGKHVVILTSATHETRLFDDLPHFLGQSPMEFPAWETLPSEEIPPSPDVVGDRYKLLHTLKADSEPRVVLATLQAALQRLLPPQELSRLHLQLKVGESLPFELIPDELTDMGYHRKAIAADKGEFATRGGILDIFPVSTPLPYRIEFDGDDIVSIRTYDPVGQTSIAKQEEVLIPPGEELELLQKHKEFSTLFDYLGPNTLVIFDDLAALEDKAVALGAQRTFASLGELLDKTGSLQKIYLTEAPLETLTEVQAQGTKLTFEFFQRKLQATRWRHGFMPLMPTFCPPEVPLEDFSTEDFLQTLRRFDFPLHFLYSTSSEKATLEAQLGDLKATLTQGYLSSGFLLQDPGYALIPMPELTHRYRVRRQKQRSHYHTLPVEMLALNAGETVVHMKSGIGRFLGIEKRPNHIGVETEFLLLEYAGGSKLYVPIEQAHLVSKYIGATDETPSLHTLGNSRWSRSVERTTAAIVGYAEELLEIQAERQVRGGYAYPSDSNLSQQFATEFPYEETPDQLLAIESVGTDMCSSSSMDRLVCGDVGYGKTEVAMRAAFKAVVDGGKQVAVLVPTTVLAMQHYETFVDRMSGFPIRIGILSRFRTPKQIKETLEGVAAGTIDILIGTHRIVSKDVLFQELGLVIIDEEQRFGVRAKEHLKKLRKEVDCLTLSATPIPRTLYMSLVGARDLSVINTPPEDRLPIQTLICQKSDEVLKNALLRELSRDGQAYVIHNRVETIFSFADHLRTLVPEARLVVGHGQMSASELDTVFHAFKSGRANVLVATSIIENGIDIPNANTILIDRADRFGLADLYQIRGRVGRWNRKAYCYFLVNNIRELSEISRKRLSALAEASGHGGGMKVAMHDLELRGAGNILGTEQSGHISAIGFHLYCKLLKKMTKALQQKGKPPVHTDVKMEFPCDARLPSTYVNEMSLRMELYGRIGDCEDAAEVDALFSEIYDRFGTPPPQVAWLAALTKIRAFANAHRFTLLKMTKMLLLGEQSHGKKQKMVRKMTMTPPKTPEEFEKSVIALLSQHFPLA